jgi:hypothetical protein
MSKPIKPVTKAPEIEALLEALSSRLARPRSEAFAERVCVTCGSSAIEFDSPISEKEYSISGMCQACQNSVFT